jgi:glycosyltransferase involved in cell wall biosynthesis
MEGKERNFKLKRVLYINPGIHIGGAERSLILLLKGIDKSKITPIVVAFGEGAFLSAVRELGITSYPVKLSSGVVKLTKLYRKYSLSSYASNLGAICSVILSLSQLIRKQRIALVHTNGIKAHFLGGFAAKLCRVPLVWHVRDFIPPGVEKDAFLLLASVMPDRIIVNSDAVGMQFSSSMKAYKKVVRIYNAVDLTEFNLSVQARGVREEFRIPNSAPLVGLIAHLTPWKGHDYFLKAAAIIGQALPEARFLIVGDVIYQTEGHETYKKDLENLCYGLRLQEKVIFTGFREDIPEIIAALDVVLHTSSQPEPFGRVLIEAMAMGKPLVATNLGGVPEVVKDGETGLLVPPRDSEALAQASIKLLKDKQFASWLGVNGLKHVRANFDARSHVQQIEALYKSLLYHEDIG